MHSVRSRRTIWKAEKAGCKGWEMEGNAATVCVELMAFREKGLSGLGSRWLGWAAGSAQRYLERLSDF